VSRGRIKSRSTGQIKRPIREYSSAFATTAIAKTSRMVEIVGLPSRPIIRIELGQRVASNRPNPTPSSFQRSRSTAGTSNPNAPHQKSHFNMVNFMLAECYGRSHRCSRLPVGFANRRLAVRLTMRFNMPCLRLQIRPINKSGFLINPPSRDHRRL